MRRMRQKELVDIELELIHETEKAYHATNGKERVWLPKSQCEYDGDAGMFTMSVWLAQEKGLI